MVGLVCAITNMKKKKKNKWLAVVFGLAVFFDATIY